MRFNLRKDKLMYLGQSYFAVERGHPGNCQKRLRTSNWGEVNLERETQEILNLSRASSVVLE